MLTKDIKQWIKEYEQTQPGNVQIDDADTDSFGDSAYHLLNRALERIEDLEGELEDLRQ